MFIFNHNNCFCQQEFLFEVITREWMKEDYLIIALIV